MKKTGISLILISICLNLFSIQPLKADTQRELVIINSVDSPVTSISLNEFRKLFLGATVVKEHIRLKPIQNISDPEIEKIFLQKVVFMSKRNYERRILSSVFRHGGERPSVYSDMSELISELSKSTNVLSYAWSDQVQNNDQIKAIGILWSGQID